jgi:hypothetical protein
MTVSDFQSCRITQDGLISVLDAIKCFNGSCREASKLIWSRISSGDRGDPQVPTGILVEFHQFPGARQRKTPIAAFNVILRILALIPGPQGAALRKARARKRQSSQPGPSVATMTSRPLFPCDVNRWVSMVRNWNKRHGQQLRATYSSGIPREAEHNRTHHPDLQR